jgi:SAM-dependent methyltransferase
MKISWVDPSNKSQLVRSGDFLVEPSGARFPVVDDIPVFVPRENYTASFGFQWNRFVKTQVDDGRRRESSQRFWAETGWNPTDLAEKRILEVGSGAGRFTAVVLRESQATLASVDYSEAVRANLENNGKFVAQDRLYLAQASIYDLPFADDYFDKVFCLGVLQHTPDFKRSVHALYEKTKPGGELVVDFYPIKGWWTKLHAKYIFRPLTKRLGHKSLLKCIEAMAPTMIGAFKTLHKFRLGALARFLPVVDMRVMITSGYSDMELKERVVLDTFDMFSPEFDDPQRIETVAGWLRDAGATVTFADFVHFDANEAAVVRCRKPVR